MQKEEAKEFFFNAILKRPVILRALLRGLSRREEEGDEREEGAEFSSSPGVPFPHTKEEPHPQEPALKKICGL